MRVGVCGESALIESFPIDRLKPAKSKHRAVRVPLRCIFLLDHFPHLPPCYPPGFSCLFVSFAFLLQWWDGTSAMARVGWKGSWETVT